MANRDNQQQRDGSMSVREAGHKGGQKERELVERGKQSEGSSGYGSRGESQR